MKRSEAIERSKDPAPTLPAVVGKPTLTDEETERVLEVMRRLKRDKFGDNGAALARALGVSQPNVSALLSRTHRPSYATAKRVASMWGVDVGDLLGRGLSARVRRVTPETHPQLFQALRMARDQVRGRARENVLAAAERLPDLALGTWLALLADPAHAAEPRPDEDDCQIADTIESTPATGPRVKSKKG